MTKKASAALGLRGRAPKTSPMRVLAFRAPAAVADYVEESVRRGGLNVSGVIVAALELDRDLCGALGQDAKRLAVFAAARGLSLQTDLADVLAVLVTVGLNAEGHKRAAR